MTDRDRIFTTFLTKERRRSIETMIEIARKWDGWSAITGKGGLSPSQMQHLATIVKRAAGSEEMNVNIQKYISNAGKSGNERRRKSADLMKKLNDKLKELDQSHWRATESKTRALDLNQETMRLAQKKEVFFVIYKVYRCKAAEKEWK